MNIVNFRTPRLIFEKYLNIKASLKYEDYKNALDGQISKTPLSLEI